MATFLTTPKMSRELAARVEASVRGRTVAQQSRKPGLVAALRLGAVAALALIIGIASVSWQRQDSAKEHARAELIAAVERESSTLEPQHLQLTSRVEALLGEALDADHDAAGGLRNAASLDEVLARPMVYVRGERAAFREPSTMREAVHASLKDAFVMCLVDPPAARSEKVLLEKVHVGYSGGLEERIRHVHRLESAYDVLPLLTRQWIKRVEDASTLAELGELRATFDNAPFERGKAAAAAELLVYVLDEPPEAGAPVEFDGASRHDVRVGIVEIATGLPLLRMRAGMDPAWISEGNRIQLAGAIDGCRLALDVRERAAEVSPSKRGGHAGAR